MRFISRVILLAGLVLPFGAFAEWSYLSGLDGDTVLLDRTTLVQNKNRNSTIWMLTNFGTPTAQDVLSVAKWIEFDCDHDRYRYLAVYGYEGQMQTGAKLIWASTTPIPDDPAKKQSAVSIVERNTAAAALMGQDRPFTATPWFWSDQYDKKLQMAGLSQGADSWALRGDMASGSAFSVYHYRAGRLIAVDSVNAAKDHMLARKLLQAGTTPAPEQVADAAFDLNSLGA